MYTYWKNMSSSKTATFKKWVVGASYFDGKELEVDIDSSYDQQEEAARRVNYLNGGKGERYPLL